MSEIKVSEIKLHKKSHLLALTFSSGENFRLSCEYLRTHAKSAEITTAEQPVSGKADVNIDKVEVQGEYALRLFFDDGYDSGIYSWETLYDLGKNYQTNWDNYLTELAKYGLQREISSQAKKGPIKLKLLYFMDKLVATTGREEEEIEIPEHISKVEELLALLRKRGMRWERDFAEDVIQVTVNKEFVELFTVLDEGDEVAFVPRPK